MGKKCIIKGKGKSNGQLSLREASHQLLEAAVSLTASPEPLSRAAVRPGLRAGVTGAAGRTGASAAAVIRRPGSQSLHSLPEQPWFRYAADTGVKEVKGEASVRDAAVNKV